MYYNDLSVYKYGRKNLGDNHLNIGWLNDDDYPKGEVPDGFLNKLKNSRTTRNTKGFHFCPFCLEKDINYNKNSSSEYEIKGNGKYYHSPSMIIHYISKHKYKPPQEFIDAVMKIKDKPKSRIPMSPRRRRPGFKTFEEHISPAGVIPGPGSSFDMFQNQRIVGNTLSSDPNTINGFNTETIKDDYFKKNDRTKKKRKRRKIGNFKKKIKTFNDFNEGAGFGSTDYRNVTGQATTSGYLNDQQPLGGGGSTTIATNAPRGNWNQPTTVIVGLKNDEISDPYFIRRKKKKEKKQRDTWERRKRNELAKKLNQSKLKDKISDDE